MADTSALSLLLIAAGALVAWLASLVAMQRRQIRRMDAAIVDLVSLVAQQRESDRERAKAATPARRAADRQASPRGPARREAIYENGTTWVQPDRLHIRH